MAYHPRLPQGMCIGMPAGKVLLNTELDSFVFALRNVMEFIESQAVKAPSAIVSTLLPIVTEVRRVQPLKA